MKKLGWLMILCLALMSCNTQEVNNIENNTTDNITHTTEANESLEGSNDSTNATEETTEETTEEAIDYTALYNEYKVNEVGQVIVLMYHNLSDKEGTYASTPDLFRADLERLYNEGYRTVSMSDLINNTIDIPIGTTPVVFTFDDATKSNFYYEEDGTVGKDSVVGILDEFYLTHEDFGRNAIFYLYGTNPFREKELLQQKLEYLIENGYEIGSHTFGHDELNNLSAEGISKTLGKNEQFIQSVIPGYQMKHLSLPYGFRPKGELESHLYNGSYEEITYEIVSAVNVGWNPIASPAASKFDATSINRITCGSDEAELHYWLDYFVNKPERRYYSDGDPSTVVVPLDQLESVNDKYLEQVITYEEGGDE